MKTSRREFLKQAGWTMIGSGLLGAVVQVPARCADAAAGQARHLYGYIVDTAKCIGCGLCAGACRTENLVPEECYRTWIEHYTVYVDGRVEVESPYGGEKGFAPSEAKGKVDRSFFVPKLCNHCKEPNCVQVCPVGATYVSREGVVLVDQKHCVGCAYCIQACPYGARFMNEHTHVADKCTWCYHRVLKGMQPACVTVCPVGARQFGKLDDPGSPVGRLIKEARLQVLKPQMGNQPMVFYRDLDKEVR
jgi:Fe-S-cluster-containing dehydrogenase component